MKYAVFFKFFKKLKSKPIYMKKIKLFVVLGFVSLAMIGGVLVWAGFSTAKHLVASANQIIISPITQTQVQSVMAELQQIQFRPLGCWVKVQSLLAVQPWLEKPTVENFINLKAACIESKSSIKEI